MKYAIMQPVYICSDTLGYDLPIGKSGFVVATNPVLYSALRYCVRIPEEQEDYWLPECDITTAEAWIAKESERIIQTSLIDFALATRNRPLFKRQTQQKERKP